MKPEDQIRALAELDNVEDIPERYEHAKQCTIQDCGSGFKPYLTSLDAIVPLIVKCCGDNQSRWDDFTQQARRYWLYPNVEGLLKLSPGQLSKVLLRAAKKWKDDK